MNAPRFWLVAAVALAGCAPSSAADASLGFGALLARTMLVLAAVCVLAVFSLRWAAARGVGRADASRRLDVIERVPVGNRQAVLAVRAGRRVVLVGASPGRLDRLAELSADEWHGAPADAGDRGTGDEREPDGVMPPDADAAGAPPRRSRPSFAELLDEAPPGTDPEAA